MKQDSGTSAAVAFIMILAVAAVAVGVFSAVVLPIEEKELRGLETAEAVSALEDTVFLMDSLAEVSFAGDSMVFTALPAGTVQTETLGLLQLEGSLPVELTSLTYSGFGGTALGISAGGVWRKDGGDSVWVMYPKTAYANGVLSFDIPVFFGDAAYGSSDFVPVGFRYGENRSSTVSGDAVHLSVHSADSWVLHLWETVFQEAAYSADALHAETICGADFVEGVFSLENGTLTVSVEEKRYEVSV